MADKVGVFISWSTPLAKGVATVLRKWLPVVVGNVKPWVSDADIAAGARGLPEIQEALEACAFGIIVVTAANQNAPWLNFEAGALSKSLNGNKALVAPLLVNLTGMTQVTGPISQFQGSLMNLDGLTRIFRSVAAAAGEDWSVVEMRLQNTWSQLSTELDAAVAAASTEDAAVPARRQPEDLIDEILDRVRLFPDQMRSYSNNAARAGRDEMEEILRKVKTWSTMPTMTEADELYVALWSETQEYQDAVVAATKALTDSWDFYYATKDLKTISLAWLAVHNGKLTGGDLSRMGVLYKLGDRTLSEDSLHHILLRHATVMRALPEIYHHPRG